MKKIRNQYKLINGVIIICLCFSVFLNLIFIHKGNYIGKVIEKIQYNKEYKTELEKYLQKEQKILLREEDEFEFLCIGNSITNHEICEYWWSECGMAATTKENDYVHLLAAKLGESYEKVYFDTCNMGPWEIQYYDRQETLVLLDEYLCEDIDLIIIQLGENASNITTFEDDLITLIEYCKKGTKDVPIIVIGNFWENVECDLKKIKACTMTDSYFLSLNKIQDNKNYVRGMGASVMGDDGIMHTVEHPGVAGHPNDEAYIYIYNEICSLLQ